METLNADVELIDRYHCAFLSQLICACISHDEAENENHQDCQLMAISVCKGVIVLID